MKSKSIEKMELDELQGLKDRIEGRIDELSPKKVRTFGDPIVEIKW